MLQRIKLSLFCSKTVSTKFTEFAIIGCFVFFLERIFFPANQRHISRAHFVDNIGRPFDRSDDVDRNVLLERAADLFDDDARVAHGNFPLVIK